MMKKLLSRAGLAAGLVAGLLVFGGTGVAEAKTTIGIYIGIPGFNYWNGPGYYSGRYRDRLSCSEGRRVVDRSGFYFVRSTDCVPRVYHYTALRRGRWYVVSIDSVTGRLSYRPR
jgi:hypothetical protein